MKRIRVAVSVLMLLSFTDQVFSAAISLSPLDQGSYLPGGIASPENALGSYEAGQLNNGLTEGRVNFFVFDLSGISDEITGFELFLEIPEEGVLLDSGRSSVTYRPRIITDGSIVSDLSTDTTSQAAYDALEGSGFVIGFPRIRESSEGSIISISSSAEIWLDLLNSANGLIAIGGAVSNSGFQNPSAEYSAFAGTSFSSDVSLVITTIPVPAAAWLFGSALGLQGWVKRSSV